MDRDNNRDRVQKAYDAIAFQKNICETSVSEYLQKCYTESQGDEFIPPMSFAKGEPIEKNDGVFFVNFRTDRARQFTQALKVSRNPEEAKKYAKWDPNFSIKPLDNLYILTMTKYYPEYD
jgi:2,3-bisphosphoglycerate-independent phosphoglycerate mutase